MNEHSTRLAAMREAMATRHIDAYIVTMQDDHISEYVAERWKRIRFLTGFTGSAGTVVLTAKAAALWADGRYTLQAAEEVDGTGIRVIQDRLPDTPDVPTWIAETVGKHAKVATDGRCVSVGTAKKWEETLSSIDWDTDLFEIFDDGPASLDESPTPIFLHTLAYTGKAAKDKLRAIRESLTDETEAVLMASLDDIAYTLNIRGGDIPYNPLVYAFLLIGRDRATLYVDAAKVGDEVAEHLRELDVACRPYDAIYEDLEGLTDQGYRTLRLDPAYSNVRLARSVPEGVEVSEQPSPVLMAKAVRNEVQLDKLANETMVLEGVALTRLSRWIKEEAAEQMPTEYDVLEKMHALRMASPNCLGDGFPSIVAFGPNAAKMHYIPTETKHAVVEPGGFLLVDTGGHYYGGTTDTTRTYAVGEVIDELKEAYTRVLMSHIRLSRAIFLKGTAGFHLDILAREPMWKEALDYKCGTGHGVGYLMSVHEGPQNFSISRSGPALQPGMVITNEPGIYRDHQFGVRTENMIVVEPYEENENGTFYHFRPLTLCPIDLDPVLPEMLSAEDLDWLNAYHELVYTKLGGHLEEDERAWLRHVTRPLATG